MMEETSSIQDPTYCKLILFEYAVKMNLKRPEYSTTVGEQMRPVFMSTLVFDGKVYKGEEGRSKKIAEQLAARVAIRITPCPEFKMLYLEVKNPSVNQSNLPAPSTPVVSSWKANDVSASIFNTLTSFRKDKIMLISSVRISESLRRVTAHRKNCDAIYSFKVNLGGMLPFSSVQEQFSYALEN
ncbi:hypothetical protein Patl1_19676 [Pistacia atlantica]|uniref:Uncharacterized protein n=1 Tax=Pistacia atlantica TaxID=434234 RepID=A0ACC1C1Q1_9ROSI|nr:hypothetical protein Patl1_19676 [Pistacia atlantica]